MYPITEAGLELYNKECPQTVSITVSALDGNFTITEEDIVQGSFSIDRYCVSGAKLEVGSAIASELKMTLINSDGRFNDKRFEGAELYVTIGIKDYSDEENPFYYVPMGYFTIDEQPRKLSTISISAVDRMVQFDKVYDSSLEYPATLAQILADACQNCNITYDVSTLPDLTYTVSERPEADNLTYRTVLQWLSAIAGVCAYIDWEGHLRLEWYTDTDIEITTAQRFSSDIQEQAVALTGVMVSQGKDASYLAGSEPQVLKIEGNGLIQGETYVDVANSLFDKFDGFSYTPYECKTISYPFLWPLDKITLVTAADEEISTIITNTTHKLNGNSTLAAKGETNTAAGYASLNPLTQAEMVIVDTAKKDAVAALNDRLQSMIDFNNLISNAMGLFTTTITNPDGSTQFYMHDNPTLEGSNTIYTINAGGFAYTNTGWNNGDPVWQYGTDKLGNAIFNTISALGISIANPNSNTRTEINNEEFAILTGEEKVVTVNKGTTYLKQMEVREHLTMGKARFFPTEDGMNLVILD